MISPPPVVRATSTVESYRASGFQERQVLLDRIAIANGRRQADNIQLAYRTTHRLDRLALRRSVADLVRRHAVLRTVFPADTDPPLARVLGLAEAGAEPIETIDNRAPELAVRDLLAADLARPFDVQHGPVFRVTVTELADGGDLLVVSFDHIAADGVISLDVIGHDLVEGFRAHLRGTTSTLPPLPFGYADFAAAHRKWLRPEVRRSLLAFWAARLPPDGLEPPIALPPRRPGTERALGRTAIVRLPLPPELVAAMPALRRQARATTFVLVLAALLSATAAMTGQPETGAMFPVDLRTQYGAAGVVGRFSNLGMLSLPIRPADRLGDVVDQVRSRLLAAAAHAHLPFGEVVREIRPDWYNTVDTPPYLFFAAQQARRSSWTVDGLTAEPVRAAPELGTQLHPGLKVTVAHTGPEAALVAQYADAAYTRETIQALLEMTVGNLTALVERPGQPARLGVGGVDVTT